MTAELANRAFNYTLTEEGDLLLSGTMPDFRFPSAAPWYADRFLIRRVVTSRGCRIGANAFVGCPALRVADLTGARVIGEHAFCDCAHLAAIVLSPAAREIAHNAIVGCPNLFLLDFVGSREELDALTARADLPLSDLILRTVPIPVGEVIASGELGDGIWMLTEDGCLTVEDAEIPDYPLSQSTPWYAHRDAITSVLIGENVERVGDRAFFGLPALGRVTVIGRTAIGESAFASCSRLAEADVFATVTEVAPYAFSGTALRTVLMPPSLSRIPEGLYQSCRSLRTLVLSPMDITEAAPFTKGCHSQLGVILIGTKEDYRKYKARGLTLTGRTILRPHPPVATELNAALEEVSIAEAAVAECREDISETVAAAVARLDRMPELIAEAEAAYMTAETRRTGFAAPLEEEVEKQEKEARRRTGRFAWRFAKKNKITHAAEMRLEKKWRLRTARASDEETRREHESAACADKTMLEVVQLLEAAVRLSALHTRSTEAVERRAALCLRAADSLFPFSRGKREKAEAYRDSTAALPALLPAETLKLAAVRAETYRGLLTYRRFADVQAGITELKAVLSGSHEAIAPAAETDTFSPRILVAGGDPTEDPATDACMRALKRAGATPVAAPLSLLNLFTTTPAVPVRNHHAPLLPKKEIDRGFDALVICGEGTVDPFLYNERRVSKRDTRHSESRTPLEVERDTRDYDLYSAFYRYGKPILGINRGCQLINVAQGGTLYRELGDKRLPHHYAEGKDVLHELRVDPASFLFAIYRPTVRPVRVLSRHRGALRDLGRELLPIARTKDETVEAFAHATLPVAGVQFSPERMIHPSADLYMPLHSIPDDGAPIFDWFLTLCRNIRKHPLASAAEGRFSPED